MSKICIVASNSLFAEDLAAQIERELSNSEIVFNNVNEDTELLLIDEDKKELRRLSENYKELPIIFFSFSDEPSNLADTVIYKPFRLASFLESLKNKTLLPKVRRKERLSFKEYTLYPVKKEIFSESCDETIKLTEKEVDILKYLYQKKESIISKEELLENVWGYSAEATTHTIETHIYRLRQKVEQSGGSQLILTENGGYRLNI